MTVIPATSVPVPPLRMGRLRGALSSYAFRVILQGLFTIWAVMTFTFVLIRLMP